MPGGEEILDNCSGLPSFDPAKVPEFVEQWVAGMQEDLPGLSLTRESVEKMPEVLADVRAATCGTTEEYDDAAGFVFFLSLVYGEILRREIKGEWVDGGEQTGFPFLIAVQKGEQRMLWNPTGKMFKMLDDPDNDDIRGFFDFVAAKPMGG
ncbi:MAG TPA: hypothetical protein VF777_06420 [Phycisphaerales bacterium]